MDKELQKRMLTMFEQQNESLLSMTKVIKRLSEKVVALEQEVNALKERK